MYIDISTKCVTLQVCDLTVTSGGVADCRAVIGEMAVSPRLDLLQFQAMFVATKQVF